MDASEYDAILRHLVQIAGHQDIINEDLRASLQEQRAFNAHQVAINQEVHTTLARIETLLARMLQPQTNGHEA